MSKQYTLEEYEALRQRVVNLRQSAIAEQGSEEHAKIWAELRSLEEELQDSKIISNNDNSADKKIKEKRNQQIFDSIDAILSDNIKNMVSDVLRQDDVNINKKTH